MFQRRSLALAVLVMALIVIPSLGFGSEILFGTIYQKDASGQVSSSSYAYVDIKSIFEAITYATITTDSNGKFQISSSNWQNGTYSIRASKPGFRPYTCLGTLKSNSSMPFCVTLSYDTMWRPSINYIHIPIYGSWGDPLRGVVNNVIPTEVKTITYINVWGRWWVKPYWTSIFTSVNKDSGIFEVNVTTGGHDDLATEYRTWLVTQDYTNDGQTLPPDPPTDQVLAMCSATRSP